MATKVGLLNAICDKLKTDVNEPEADASPQNTSNNKNGQGTPYSSYCSSPVTVQDLSNHATLDLSTRGTPVQDSQDSPRKNRRKAAAPRCLKSYEEETYQKDDLEEFEANNKDVDFTAYTGDLDENSNQLNDDNDDDDDRLVDGSDGENFRNELSDDEDDDGSYARDDSDVDQSPALSPDENSSDERDSKIQDDKPNTDDFGAIDLSVQKSHPKKPRSPSPKVTNQVHGPVNLKVERRLSGSVGKNSGEAADLKDYAESTMNELLSLYGLSEDSGTIAKNVPLQNFSSGRILERHVGGLHNGRPLNRMEAEGRNAHLYPKYAESLSKGFNAEAPLPISSQPPHVVRNHDDYDRDTDTPTSVDASNHAKSGSSKSNSATNSPGNGRFVESAAYIRACFNKDMASEAKSLTESLSGKLLPDYAKYIKRFSGFEDCKGTHCQDMMYREHYHCMDCSFKVFIKKEEMIRHFKWHKKRDESLQHGFMRYSPLDDCEDRFGECTHNKKQTHYHCLQSGCNKVYISTSDVQMHANYHRKDSAIIQEGFQRFRATEDCGTTKCQFYGQRTTHFHCRRHGCDFTFKNKADMEKHKTYHQKDEVLSKDGFKKFMKYEHCSYDGCKYSKISNHIHCIRTGCNYVLHSTGQLYSHKRKHERRDFEFAYKRFKQESGDDKGCSSNDGSSIGGPSDAPSPAPSTQVRPIAPRLGPPPQLPQGPVLPRPLSLPQQHAAPFSPAEKALMTAIGLQSQSGKPIPSNKEQHNDPEYMDLEDLKNFDTKMINSGTSTPDSSSPPPTSHPAHQHSKFSLTAEMRRQHLQSAFAFARYASVLQNAELNNSLSLPIPNFMANRRSEEAASHTVTREDARTEVSSDAHSVTRGTAVTMPHDDVVVKEERESPVPGALHVKQELDEEVPPPSPPGGEQPLLHRPLPKIMEKKERDESWKKYMIRYTANDPCRARCSMLYKDHYHCNVEGCDVMFYTKERVREHARLHDQDEKVTELTFHTTTADHPCCVEGCDIEGQKHYHCLWPECDHVIHVTEPPLTRLKHHRHHEQQRTSNNLRWRAERTMPLNEGILRRKRGRPPKYPKDEIPLVPKVNVTENALYETSTPVSVKITREMFVLSSTKIVNGFKMFEAGFPCPDQLCAYFMKEHYHCVRPRCHHATNSADVMNLHAREFHNYVSIMEGFEFFDRGVNCRRPHCQNNKTNRHFHCVRPRCDYSFVRHSTMFQHDKKHHEGYKPPKPAEEPEKSPTSPLDDLKSKTVIKASGTFYPMSTIPLHKPIAPKNSSGIPQPVPIKMEPSLMRPIASIPPFMTNPSSANSTFFVPMASAASMMNLVSMPTAIPIFTAPIMAFPPMTMAAPIIQLPSTPTSTATSGEITLQQANAAAEALKDLESSNQESNRSLDPSLDPNNPLAGQKSLPLTVLLQQKTAHAPQTESWHNLRSKMHYILNQNCGRPFCKLKKRDHYHCFDCNQAFSDPERLKTHVGRHGIKFERNKQPKLMIKSPGSSRNGAFDDEDSSSHASDLNSSLNLNGEEFSNMMSSAQKDIPEIVTNNMDIDEATNDTMDGNYGNLEIDLDSSSELNSSMEDSSSRRSSRKRTLTRGQEDYADADAVVVKHRRVTSPRVYKDEPVPDGYTRYWAHEDCGRRGCSYRQSTTHFHCRRKSCGFGICSRIRIEQHTIRHQRIDKITGDDFEQYRANLECGFQKCLFSNQATHFHCLKCSFTCTDTIKVTTHRKQHNKKDFFISQGFQKYSSGQNCKQDCKHNQRQTHYHCIVCGSPVVGQSQMAPHRLKHAGLGRYTLVNMSDSVAAKAKGGKSSSAAVS